MGKVTIIIYVNQHEHFNFVCNYDIFISYVINEICPKNTELLYSFIMLIIHRGCGNKYI